MSVKTGTVTRDQIDHYVQLRTAKNRPFADKKRKNKMYIEARSKRTVGSFYNGKISRPGKTVEIQVL